MFKIQIALRPAYTEPDIIGSSDKVGTRVESSVNTEAPFGVKLEAPSDSYLVLLLISSGDAKAVFGEDIVSAQ